jgi:hypothetical protein
VNRRWFYTSTADDRWGCEGCKERLESNSMANKPMSDSGALENRAWIYIIGEGGKIEQAGVIGENISHKIRSSSGAAAVHTRCR